MSGTNCMEQTARDENIKNNKSMALHYIESTPNIEFNDEKEFISVLLEQIKDDTALPYVVREELEKEYVKKRVENLKLEGAALKAATLLDEFDNALCLFIANGLLEVTDKKFDKIYVNEDQLNRIKNHYFNDNGKSYIKRKKK